MTYRIEWHTHEGWVYKWCAHVRQSTGCYCGPTFYGRTKDAAIEKAIRHVNRIKGSYTVSSEPGVSPVGKASLC